MKQLRKNIFILLTFLWLGVIFSFSLQPAEVSNDTSMDVLKRIMDIFSYWLFGSAEELSPKQLDLLHTIIRKCAHFSEFLILGLLAETALGRMNLKHRIIIGITFCVLSAAADETLQLFINGRAGRVTDVIIDSAGAAVGIAMISAILYKIRVRS